MKARFGSPRFLQQAALLGGLLAGMPLPAAVFAADATKPLNVQQAPVLPKFVPKPADDAFQLPVIPPASPSPAKTAGGEPVLIRNIQFKGNSAVPTSELVALAAPYLGKSLNIAELEELRQRLTRHYIELGYINSGAWLDKDAIAGDTLTIRIIEGKLKTIRLRGLQRLDEGYVANRLVKEADAPLNVEQLRESFQLLLSDPLFERLNARLMPGDMLGEAVLDIDATRARPYQLTAFTNNYRPPSIGEKTYGLSGWVRNLSGSGDLLEATLQAPIQDAAKDGNGGHANLTWHMPLNQRGTQMSMQVDRGRSSVIEEPIQVLDIKSTLISKDIGISHVFYESLKEKLAIGVHRVWRENRTTLLDTPFSFVAGEPDGVTKLKSWRFWQEYSHRTEKQVLALRSTFTWSHDNLTDIGGPPSSAGIAARRYTSWLGQAQYARQVLDNGTQMILKLTQQYTRHHILALDQISVGGVNTVRGYRENQLIRDLGTVVNVEFDYPLIRNPGSALNLSLIPFYDYGQAKNQNENKDVLSSVGLATRLRWQGLNFDLAVAKRLRHPDTVNALRGSMQDQSIHLQLGYNFFGH